MKVGREAAAALAFWLLIAGLVWLRVVVGPVEVHAEKPATGCCSQAFAISRP